MQRTDFIIIHVSLSSTPHVFLCSFLCCSPAFNYGTAVAHHGLFVTDCSGVGARRWIPVWILVSDGSLGNIRWRGSGICLVDVHPPNVTAARHSISGSAQRFQSSSWLRGLPATQGVGGATHGGMVRAVRQNNTARGKCCGALGERLRLSTAAGFHYTNHGIVECRVCICYRDCRAAFVRETWETGAAWHSQPQNEKCRSSSTEHRRYSLGFRHCFVGSVGARNRVPKPADTSNGYR